MIIKNLHLKNFRNYENADIEYENGINIVSGRNAQGKTNSVEAIFFLCTGYSPRATKDKQMIMQGENNASVSATAISKYGEICVSCDLFGDKKKEIKVNGVPLQKIGELLGNINSVFFNPAELRLIQDAPEDRRRFLDISLSQLDREYFYSLQVYKRILTQRNNLLKEQDKGLILDTLNVWDESLVEVGAKIIKKRNEFVSLLSPLAFDAYRQIAGDGEEFKVAGDTDFFGDEKKIKEDFLIALKERYENDMQLGHTTVGPHRDDLKLKVDGIDVKTYGSQGQQRTCAIALKLAEAEIFNMRFNEYPVLILDDAMSELDGKRRERLLNAIKKMQTIITCTEPEIIPDFSSYNNIRIDGGKIL